MLSGFFFLWQRFGKIFIMRLKNGKTLKRFLWNLFLILRFPLSSHVFGYSPRHSLTFQYLIFPLSPVPSTPRRFLLLFVSPLYMSCYVAFLGLWIVSWLSFTLQLVSTYEWIFTMFVFWVWVISLKMIFFSSSIHPFAFNYCFFPPEEQYTNV